MKCILFDLVNTLLLKKPSIPEKIYEMLSLVIPNIQYKTTEHAYADGELWTGIQIRKENETGILMSDEEFAENLLACYGKYISMTDEISESLISILSGKYSYRYEVMSFAYVHKRDYDNAMRLIR